MILGSSLGHIYLVPGMALTQYLYTLFFISVRPFSESTNNLIELINELFFCFFTTALLKFNSVKTWTSGAKNLYIYSLIANNLLVVLIISGKF